MELESHQSDLAGDNDMVIHTWIEKQILPKYQHLLEHPVADYQNIL